MYMGKNSIVKYLENNTDCDFVAYVITPFHLQAFYAAYYSINNIKKNIRGGLIVAKPDSSGNFLIEEKDILENDFKLVYYREDESNRQKIEHRLSEINYYLHLSESNKEPFYIFIPMYVNYIDLQIIDKALNYKRKIIGVSIDEGASTYMLTDKDWLFGRIREAKSARGVLSAFVSFIETKLFSESKAIKTGRYIDCKLLINDSGSLKPNRLVLSSFKKLYATNNKTIAIHPTSNYVIITTQPLDGIYPSDIPDKIVYKCAKSLEEVGIVAYVKPHPRERNLSKYENMGLHLVKESTMSLEVMISQLQAMPLAVISFFSTTLVTCKLFYEINTISLDKVLLSNAKLSHSSMVYINKFEKCFANVVKFPKNYDEVINMTLE